MRQLDRIGGKLLVNIVGYYRSMKLVFFTRGSVISLL